MTRQELVQRILTQLDETPEAPVFWTLDECAAMLQEGYEVLAEETQALHKTAHLVRDDGRQLYTLQGIADDCMAPYRVWVVDRDHPLRVISMAQLDSERQRWWTVQGNQPEWWYPVSWHAFGIYPATATGGGVLRVDYLAWPQPLLADADEPDLPVTDQDTLVAYGVYRGLLKQFDLARALDLYGQFVSTWRDGRAQHGGARVPYRGRQAVDRVRQRSTRGF